MRKAHPVISCLCTHVHMYFAFLFICSCISPQYSFFSSHPCHIPPTWVNILCFSFPLFSDHSFGELTSLNTRVAYSLALVVFLLHSTEVPGWLNHTGVWWCFLVLPPAWPHGDVTSVFFVAALTSLPRYSQTSCVQCIVIHISLNPTSCSFPPQWVWGLFSRVLLTEIHLLLLGLKVYASTPSSFHLLKRLELYEFLYLLSHWF